jgi:uncharacterized protein (TIGR00251 family)
MPRPRPTPRLDNAALLDVRVVPRAGKSGVAGLRDGALLVRLAAAPVDGAANAELIAVLADALHLPKRSIQIVSGDRSRSKRVRVEGLDAASVLTALKLDGPA